MPKPTDNQRPIREKLRLIAGFKPDDEATQAAGTAAAGASFQRDLSRHHSAEDGNYPTDGPNNPIFGMKAGSVMVYDARTPMLQALLPWLHDGGLDLVAVQPDSATGHGPWAQVRGDLTTPRRAACLAGRLARRDTPLAAAVVYLPPPRQCGALLSDEPPALAQFLDTLVMPHVHALRALLPQLANGGRYLMVDGPGADYPWAGYGSQSVAAAASQMLARVLHQEAARFGVRVQQLTLPRCPEQLIHYGGTITQVALTLLDLLGDRPAARSPVVPLSPLWATARSRSMEETP